RAEPDDPTAAAAALCLADVRAVQQLLARSLSASVSVRTMAIHRADVSLPARAARLALGLLDMGRRPLVVPPQPDPPRLVAHSVLVIENWPVVSGHCNRGWSHALNTDYLHHSPLTTRAGCPIWFAFLASCQQKFSTFCRSAQAISMFAKISL